MVFSFLVFWFLKRNGSNFPLIQKCQTFFVLKMIPVFKKFNSCCWCLTTKQTNNRKSQNWLTNNNNIWMWSGYFVTLFMNVYGHLRKSERKKKGNLIWCNHPKKKCPLYNENYFGNFRFWLLEKFPNWQWR